MYINVQETTFGGGDQTPEKSLQNGKSSDRGEKTTVKTCQGRHTAQPGSAGQVSQPGTNREALSSEGRQKLPGHICRHDLFLSIFVFFSLLVLTLPFLPENLNQIKQQQSASAIRGLNSLPFHRKRGKQKRKLRFGRSYIKPPKF